MSRLGRISLPKRLSSNRLKVAFYKEFDLMFLLKRALVVVAGAAVMVSTLHPTASYAAQSGVTKVYVPANIVKGSAVASGRSFYTTKLPEDSLAGIRLGRPAKEVLAKWGNPTRITVGTAQAEGPDQSAQPSGPAYTPAPSPYESLSRSMDTAASIVGIQPPGLPGPAPYPGPSQDTPKQPSAGGGQSATLTAEEVTWTYDLPNGITLEFIITDGLITQITAGGIGPWELSKTRTGLQLGDTYKLVLWVCGYPEYQKYADRFLRVSYVNKNRALFTFLNRKLVGITIAMVPQELL